MATAEELNRAFSILLGAGLDFSPSVEEMPIRANAWKELLADIPGELLIQGAKDIALAGEKFPSVKRVRDAAYQVRVHNGTSAAVNHFGAVNAGRQYVPEIQYPPAVLAEIERVSQQYSGEALPPDDVFNRLEELTRPYREAVIKPAPMR